SRAETRAGSVSILRVPRARPDRDRRGPAPRSPRTVRTGPAGPLSYRGRVRWYPDRRGAAGPGLRGFHREGGRGRDGPLRAGAGLHRAATVREGCKGRGSPDRSLTLAAP